MARFENQPTGTWTVNNTRFRSLGKDRLLSKLNVYEVKMCC